MNLYGALWQGGVKHTKHPKVALYHMITILRLGSFADSLRNKPTADREELRHLAAMLM